jgi:hypothetical protein
MAVIPAGTFYGCGGMTTVGCDLSHVTFHRSSTTTDATPSSAAPRCSLPRSPRTAPTPFDVRAYLKGGSLEERRVAARYATYACVRRARKQEGQPRTIRSPHQIAFAMATLPPDMNRAILEFTYGVAVVQM